MSSESVGDVRTPVMELLQTGKNTEARDLGIALVSSDRENYMAWLMLGIAQLRLGELREAETSGRAALALRPDDPEAGNVLAESLLLQGRFAESVEHYRQVIARAPAAINALIGLGNACMGMHDCHAAIESYRRALAIHSGHGIVHFYLSEAYLSLSRLKEAEASSLEAVRLSGGNAEPHINLARVYQRQGRLQAAVASLRQALKLAPDSNAAYHNLGVCLFDDQNPEPALQSLRRAVELNPSNLLTHAFLAILYSMRGDQAQADIHFHTAGQSQLEASICAAWEYANSVNPSARLFSTTRQILDYAIDATGFAGLYLEFGVCYGASISMIAERIDGVVHGFDSFEGLPESWNTGVANDRKLDRMGAYTTCGTLPPVPGNVCLHAGLFEDTLPAFVAENSGAVSFINIDCDLYSSTTTIFSFLGARIQPGTVIVFDEYFCYPEWREHEYRAFQEFVALHRISYEYLAFSFFTGQVAVRILSIG